jgi:hypothetical protein
MLDWISEHKDLLWLGAASVVVFVIATVAVAIVIVRIPPDYFEREGRGKGDSASAAWRIARNILGWLLLIAGLAMLIFPGPGLLVILIGVMLADFPGKLRVQRWIISRGQILRSANWLRAKFGKPPLKVPRGAERQQPALNELT